MYYFPYIVVVNSCRVELVNYGDILSDTEQRDSTSKIGWFFLLPSF
jgi:hypothetical protein